MKLEPKNVKKASSRLKKAITSGQNPKLKAGDIIEINRELAIVVVEKSKKISTHYVMYLSEIESTGKTMLCHPLLSSDIKENPFLVKKVEDPSKLAYAKLAFFDYYTNFFWRTFKKKTK